MDIVTLTPDLQETAPQAVSSILPPPNPVPPSIENEKIVTGRVIRSQSGFFTVETPAGVITSQISGKIKNSAHRAKQRSGTSRSDLVALNDTVTLELDGVDRGTILKVAERQHVLSRVSRESTAGTSAESEQIIIANTDQVIFVFSASNPTPNPRSIDRFLVCAERANIPSIVICINKIDLVPRPEMEEILGGYNKIGYQVLYVSALTGEGLDSLRTLFSGDPNRVSVFTGPSGVGKSSLLNAMQEGLKLETSDVSQATSKGRHTTRFSQLIKMNEGGYVADTPGLRTMVPWDVEPDELDSYFIEMRPYVETCKFADCSHRHEPGCAIRAAVEAGTVSEERYDSYLRLRDELDEQYIY
ncbi:MAG: ribosome small subunit-dependent GTPase A [Chloroflexi bacterium]|nr:ribosome small subunit-dependent GTPase A [Chloroflexota bacterium]